MQPEMARQLAAERVKEMRRAGAVARLRAVTPDEPPHLPIVVRHACAADDLALAALAALDGAKRPLGRTLVAELDGSIVAALPLDGAGPFSDPFRRTADLVALLEARARQIAAQQARGRRPRLAWLSPAALRRLV